MLQWTEVPEQATRTVCRRQETDALREPHDRVPYRVRMGKLFDWSAVDRCRLLILLTVPFFAGYALRSHYLLAHPNVEPYYDRATLVSMRSGLVAACFFWALFLAWGSLERRRPGSHTLYLVVGSLSWWLGVVSVAYALGPITTPAWIAVVIGCVTNLLLLPRRVAVLAISVGLTLLLASLVGVMTGVIPYAPALAHTPIVASQMALPFALGNTISSTLATLIVVGVIAYIMTQWRDAIDHLQRVNTDLDRVDRGSDIRTRAAHPGGGRSAGERGTLPTADGQRLRPDHGDRFKRQAALRQSKPSRRTRLRPGHTHWSNIVRAGPP